MYHDIDLSQSAVQTVPKRHHDYKAIKRHLREQQEATQNNEYSASSSARAAQQDEIFSSATNQTYQHETSHKILLAASEPALPRKSYTSHVSNVSTHSVM